MTGPAGSPVQITVNGEPRLVRPGETVENVVGATTTLTSGVAAAVNGDVVPRGRWKQTVLADGDHVEVVTAVHGG